jgi:NitT/TauT family transport system ATP-binding protein
LGKGDKLGMTLKLRLVDIRKEFIIPRSGSQIVAVDDFNLEVYPGEFLTIVGPSGCGKSTILNILAGLETPTSGRVEMDGKSIRGPAAERGMVFQDYALFPWKTVWENIEFGPRYGPRAKRISTKERHEMVRELVDLVNLNGSEQKYPHELSGGMRQRCAIARLLANEPEVLLMDEPFAAVDMQSRIILQEELLRIWGQERPANQRKTVVFITHAIDEAVFLSDRVVVMTSHPGRLKHVADIPLPRPRNDEVRAVQEYQHLIQEIWGQIREEVYEAVMQKKQLK